MSSTPPNVSVAMAIEPARFTKASDVSLSLTITSHAASSLTIFTWPTVFNLPLAQVRDNFQCTDLANNDDIFLALTKGPRRPGFSMELGGRDDAYFCTLEPGEPKTFTDQFVLARSVGSEAQTEQCRILEGHHYRFEAREGQAINKWWWGAKEEVMGPSGTYRHLREADGDPIVLNVNPVDFEVVESESS